MMGSKDSTMKNILIASILLLTAGSGLAEIREMQDTTIVHFRQGKSVLQPELGNNREALGNLISSLRASKDSTNKELKSITFTGSASPEGPVLLNRNLSEKRAEVIFSYLSKYVDLPDSILKIDYTGRDWRGLRLEVEKDPSVPYRDQVLTLLDSIIASPFTGTVDDPRHPLRQLENLEGGEPYRYMYSRLFPGLRATKVITSYQWLLPAISLDNPELLSNVPYLWSEPEITEFTYFTEFIERPKEMKNFYMALKSNLLYDALALPSLSAEFYLGKNFSVVGNWTYGWWDRNSSHRYWRAYGGDVALRWWFGRAAEAKPLTGHHLGIYGGAYTFDFEFGGKGVMGGLPGKPLWSRCLPNVGIEYGYSLPVGRRINFDFTIGFGYFGGKYIKYEPCGDHYKWDSTNRLTYFGPTKLEVSLVWLLGHGNVNKKKGGTL